MIRTTRTVQPDGSFVEESTQQQSSVVIKRNAKAEFSWDMKIYNDDPEEYRKTADEFLKQIHTTIDNAQQLQL